MPDTNKDNQQNDPTHLTDKDISAYNPDPEYISKIINHFILDNNDTKPTQKSKPTNHKHQYNRQHIIDALSKMQLTFRTNYICGQSNHIDTDDFREMIVKEIIRGKSWKLTRRKVMPCKKCVYCDICPPISNYEKAIGKYNLCKIVK